MPSFIVIRPTVWPQYTNVTDRTDRQDGQRTDNIAGADAGFVTRGRDRESGDGSPPAGCKGGAPVGGLGDKVPRS